MTRASARDRGLTLLELLITMALMGLAFAAVLGGMGLFLKAENTQRSNATLDADVRTYAESLAAAPYINCAEPASYSDVAAPPGYRSSVEVAYWDGNLPASFASSCSTDLGVQRITVTLATPTGVTAALVVGKSR